MENKDTHKSAEKSAVAAREEEILKFWRDNDIFRKSLEKPSPKGNYVFYDGPPFATGLPHFGHMLPTTIKDAIPRFRTMQGYHVMRRWGWDCHGLPIENLIEKELGLDTKKDIEEYGIEKFNVAARGKVLQYADEWKEIIPRLGRWVDMENDYRTMDSSYTESVWWSWKQLNEKNLVYRSFKVMYICPRCETTLSNFEVNQGYKDIADISVYARFKVKNQNAKIKNIIEKSKIADLYLLAWTTTPWTLPGNVALAVKNDIAYSVVKNSKENGEAELVVIAQPLFEKLKGKFSEPEIVGELKGSDLVGTEYEPLFDYYANDSKLKNRENGWKVIAADFVTMEEGTGIVHVAPAFGAEDFEAAEKENLPFVQHVTMHGVFKPEVKDFAGLLVKAKDSPEDPNAHQATDIEIIKFLAAHGTLFAKEKITHSYPHCWRCSTPLLNYATTSWFVKVTALKDTLLKNNGTVSWVPEEIGEGRFGKWLDGARDWAVSRSRYWGAPLPVWICEKCETQEFAGSVDELSSKIGRGNTFVAMRHGESENVVKEITSSDNSVPSHLTDAGKRQVREAAEKLKANGITAIYASPLFRTKETAEIAADVLGLDPSKIIYDDRLKEI
ncbi:MAG TPA: class I tRNA ligase family protein, partial [Candidatus Paceibacterota bacterium]|nr:class I tRNA ligase family protein [Candidatus Paceibacterota bacterium]